MDSFVYNEFILFGNACKFDHANKYAMGKYRLSDADFMVYMPAIHG